MRIFGLIGKTLEHSFSPGFFNEKFLRENHPDCSYKLFPLLSIEQIIDLAASNPEIKGFNVTIPYKQEVIPFLNEVSPDVKKLGAVNTIKIQRSAKQVKLSGFNTDTFGFQHACSGLRFRQPALILGTGGSAQAVKFVLKKFQIPFISVSRNPKGDDEISYTEVDDSIVKKHLLIINTTPLGMFPNVDAYPQIPYDLLTKNHFLYDLIYNPLETKFLRFGRLAGCQTENGQLMLELQAERSWEIWNS
jgi:shikimate dehydrogenase